MPSTRLHDQTPERSDNDRAIFASLNAIHSAANGWQTELSAIVDAPPGTPEAKQAMIEDQLKRKPQIEAVVSESLGTIANIFGQDIKEREWGAAIRVNLDLSWKDIENHWSLSADKPDAALDIIRWVRDRLDDIIYTCLSNTMTADINDRLPNLQIGQPLDVAFIWADELPRSPDLRKRLILEVAQEQGVISCGVVDADKGLIYRIAASPKQRRKSLWHVAGLILLGLLLPIGAAYAGVWLSSWPYQPAKWSTLVANYVLLFAGAAGHLLIDALKQKRGQPASCFAAMDNWLLWVHVREMSLLYSILWADLGFVLLTGTIHDLDWRGAFAAGYSIDSITDLFLSRFETLIGQAAAQIKPLTAA
jgi:hypothetical protein